MSAIAAIFWKDGRPAETETLEHLAQGLRPYGRLHHHYKTSLNCGLACSNDTPHAGLEPQPLTCAYGRHLFVFDGRLDNREEIARHLGDSGVDSETTSDAALAFRAWLQSGEQAVKMWSGEFAFICWDARDRVATAARDHIGLRALCYHETLERIVIASAPRALFALPDIERTIDEQKIADQLVQLFHDGERTYYKDIKRVLPGHILRATDDKTNSAPYWSLDDAPEVRYASDEEYVDAGLALFNDVVRAQVSGETKIGTFLSGGLDSSSVAVAALDHLPQRQDLPAFTWIPSKDWDGHCRDGAYGDETPFIEDICMMHPRIKPDYIRSEGHGLFYQLDEFLDYSGVAPRNAINLCWIHDINMAARDLGLNVLMEGGMGNMSLSWNGEGVFLERWKQRDYSNLAKDILKGPGGCMGLLRRLGRGLVFPLSPDWVREGWLRARQGRNWLPHWQRHSAINPDFAREKHVVERMEHYGWDFFSKPVRDTRALRAQMISGSFSHERADIRQAFRAMYGVETRDPFSDRRLIEWSLGVPESQYRHFGEGRWLIKRMMKNKLPSSVLKNRKVGEQVIDWHARISWDLPRLREELETIADDPDTSRFIDVELIKKYLGNWPSETPLNPKERGYAFVPVSIGSAIAAARLVRRTKGSNR